MGQSSDWSKYVRSERITTFDMPFTSTLTIDAGPNGSVKLVNTRGSDLSVKATAEIWQPSDAGAPNNVELVTTFREAGHLTARNNNIGLQQPWGVTYEVSVPRGVTVSVITQNGSVSASDLDSALILKSQNGSIQLKNDRGPIDAFTANGQLIADIPETTEIIPNFTLRTLNGEIRATLHRKLAEQTSISSRYGKVTNPQANEEKAQEQSAREIKSQNGNIQITVI